MSIYAKTLTRIIHLNVAVSVTLLRFIINISLKPNINKKYNSVRWNYSHKISKNSMPIN
jgi:hypothetical protein